MSSKVNITLSNLDTHLTIIPSEKRSQAKTVFFKKLSLKAHKFYGGKIMMIPKVALPSNAWLNAWYTPGVSSVSTAIRDDNHKSFYLTNRSNSVAIISDSTRVLGDGDCTPPGGLGVMEGKAFLMKLLGGVDATALCINSKDKSGRPQAQKIIDFALACEHSFGAINLEDISNPNCYKVLDELRKQASIPVWHDDAQGTACIILAGLINALILAEKKIEDVKIVLFGAGAANSMCAEFIIKLGANPHKLIILDSKGPLHFKREDLEKNSDYYKQWSLCKRTNPECISSMDEAIKDADVLIALSKQGPDTIKEEWVKSMNERSIVFACANPIPEIYPDLAHKAGAFITATGRGDFDNQLNNSVCFPAILKGVLLCGAKAITDSMAIASAKAIAEFAQKRGITTQNITAKMEEDLVYPYQAKAVVEQAIKEGLNRIQITPEKVYEITKKDIEYSKQIFSLLQKQGFIADPPQTLIDEALRETLKEFN